jgi:hypothetical protein
MAPTVQTEREPDQEKSPPRRPVKEMQRMSHWVQSPRREIAEKRRFYPSPTA